MNEKKTGCLKLILGGILFFLIWFLIEKFSSSSSSTKTETSTTPKTNEERANSLTSGWNGSIPSVVKFVKNSMNDPDSFEHVETRTGFYETNNFIVSMKYRGKNPFGGVITKYIDIKVDYSGNVISVEKEY
jgi:hypothetical protein